jgi:hypothetical protein
MNVTIRLFSRRPPDGDSYTIVNTFEMSLNFPSLPQKGDKITLPQAADLDDPTNGPQRSFTVNAISWEVVNGDALPWLVFHIDSDWSDEKRTMESMGWKHVNRERVILEK